MNCRDCVYFKTWKSFDMAMCEVTKKQVEPLAGSCENFAPRGLFSEWGENNSGEKCS